MYARIETKLRRTAERPRKVEVMTFRGIVEGMCERKAKKWLKSFVDDKQREVWWRNTNLEKDGNDMTWEVGFEVLGDGYSLTGRRIFTVGGAVDEAGCWPSVIWEKTGRTRKYVWASHEGLRKTLGIKGEFRI